ncbi:hypothetical protein JW968_03170 [Candidatus Woesearchaeota archaeon]|nr:hypothetical protein [Candidatus Woesearchaeota archaeon]
MDAKQIQKYGLDHAFLDHEFEISKIEVTNFVLRDIRGRILEKINQFLEIVTEIIQPDNKVTSFNEIRFFSDKEKIQVFNTMRKLKIMHREGLKLEIDSSEEKEIKYIKKTTIEWNDLKREMLQIVDKLQDAWKKELRVEKEVEYFG